MIFLSSKETAEKLGISHRTLANMRVKGAGPIWIKFGWGIMYPINEVDKYIASNKK